METKLFAVMPAAGVGSRAQLPDAPLTGLPKQYRLLRGEPMLRWSVRALLADARIAQVCVVVSEDDAWVEDALQGLPRTFWCARGGPTRAHSVLGGLEALPAGDDDWVLVHDAARPGLPADALHGLVDACLDRREGGLLATPVADTVKRQLGSTPPGEAAVAGETLDRAGLWLAQTPQMFRVGQLYQALQAGLAAGLSLTDEASAIEAQGGRVQLVTGSPRNFKVTWPDDFTLMERWLD